MQTVKALKALPGRQEGSVFSVDEASAKVLKERGDVVLVTAEAAPEAGGVFVRTTTRRSGAAVTQVAEADYPEAGKARKGKSGDAAGETGEAPTQEPDPTPPATKTLK